MVVYERVPGSVLLMGTVQMYLVEGWLRPGYNAFSMFVCGLSPGPRGWMFQHCRVILGDMIINQQA